MDSKKTIKDFGDQWKIHGQLPSDYWTHDDMFRDYLCGLIDPIELTDSVVAEVGSGSGRIVRMLSRYNPRTIFAIEPSYSVSILERNTRDLKNVTILNTTGDQFKLRDLDYVVCLGVLHHVPDPISIVKNVYDSLRTGGKFIVWVYGIEGNEIYYSLYRALSVVTKRLPNRILDIVSDLLQGLTVAYGWISKNMFRETLPLSNYIVNVFMPCSRLTRKYIVFDQLNPQYSKYYLREEVFELLHSGGFTDVKVEARHGYSHTAVATK
jgi:SAM-dependent methyltransferase